MKNIKKQTFSLPCTHWKDNSLSLTRKQFPQIFTAFSHKKRDSIFILSRFYILTIKYPLFSLHRSTPVSLPASKLGHVYVIWRIYIYKCRILQPFPSRLGSYSKILFIAEFPYAFALTTFIPFSVKLSHISFGMPLSVTKVILLSSSHTV